MRTRVYAIATLVVVAVTSIACSGNDDPIQEQNTPTPTITDQIVPMIAELQALVDAAYEQGIISADHRDEALADIRPSDSPAFGGKVVSVTDDEITIRTFMGEDPANILEGYELTFEISGDTSVSRGDTPIEPVALEDN